MKHLLRAFGAALALWLVAAMPAGATVTSTVTKMVAVCNSVTTNFNFPFIAVAPSDVVVTLTDSTGVSTVQAATKYTLTINPPASNSVWGVGGIVVYPNVGSPCPTGATLTIARNLPLIQTTPFATLGANLPTATETSLDILTMQVQQLNTLFAGALVQPLTDTQAFSALPGAAARANLALCFDATGYVPTACSMPASGTISSAMQPVVSAGSLASGRTALGLGGAAVENIGAYGLADDGSGNLRQSYPVTSDAINQSVTAAFHNSQRVCTGPVTYTLPRANTLQSGFNFSVIAASGNCTVLPNASDSFPLVGSGVAVAIPAGSVCAISTDAANSGTWRLNCNGENASVAANASGNALTVTVVAPALQFRNPTPANGGPLWAVPSGNLSITIPSGASLGTPSGNVPFRVWIFAAYNSGTPVLGVAVCSGTSGVVTTFYPCAGWETIQKTAAGISAGSTSAGTLYTSSSITNDAIRIIGYADYASGLATAGTWASNPTTLQLCIQPFRCAMPGTVLQKALTVDNTGTSTGSATFVATTQTTSLTMTSAANRVVVRASGVAQNAVNQPAVFQIQRSASLICDFVTINASGAGVLINVSVSLLCVDSPGAGTPTYTMMFKTAGGTAIYNGAGMELEEIMGALEPANDNGGPLSLVG